MPLQHFVSMSTFSLQRAVADNDLAATGSGSEEDAARLQDVTAKFQGYAADFEAATPEKAAKRCLVAIERTSLEGGYGGSFLSHNGTKKWL